MLSFHPLFIATGIWYSFIGELPLFLMSCLVAVQHECAHAFAAAKLGYELNKIVLMPYGAVIDGDLQSLALKDEISVALAGPICNLCTAALFAAFWWFAPTMYAFTDTVYYSSLSIALVNLLPAFPLDGGRILRATLAKSFAKKHLNERKAYAQATTVCKGVTMLFALCLLGVFGVLAVKNAFNVSLLFFGVFLLFGALGNGQKTEYQKLNLATPQFLRKGVEIKRVAVWEGSAVKDILRYITSGSYLILEVYDEQERKQFELTQNEFSKWFLLSTTPYETLKTLHNRIKNTKNPPF